MTDKLRSSQQMALRHLAGSHADRLDVLWPGGDQQDSQEGVEPVAEALLMIMHREGELACGKPDEVQLLLREGEKPTLRMHVRIEAHIYNIGGVVTATAGGIQTSQQMSEEAARQVYGHYLEKYGGEPLYLLSRKDMENTSAMMLLEDTRQEDP